MVAPREQITIRHETTGGIASVTFGAWVEAWAAKGWQHVEPVIDGETGEETWQVIDDYPADVVPVNPDRPPNTKEFRDGERESAPVVAEGEDPAEEGPTTETGDAPTGESVPGGASDADVPAPKGRGRS